MKKSNIVRIITISSFLVAIFIVTHFLLTGTSVEAATKTFLIDFGRSTTQTTTTGWNNIISPATGAAKPLVDSTGASTPVSLQITNSFYYESGQPADFSINPNGTTSSTLYPASATRDSFFLGTVNITDTSAIFVVNGLSAGHTYDFQFYGSRMVGDTSNRTAQYTIGATTVELNARDNVNNYVEILGVVPTNGSITVQVVKKSTAVYGYLNVLRIVDNIPGTNVSPTASAGIDQTITLPTSSVTLSGSGSDSDGTISTYAWTKVSGTGGAITSPASASTGITGLSAGTYIFRLTVTDNLGATASDDVQVIVNPAPVNQAPTANAGTDQSITLPISSVTLSGSGFDSDGSIASYAWSFISGPITPTIVSSTSATTSVTSLTMAGEYLFRLTVTDNQGASTTDDVIVIVNPAPNVSPTSNAGADQSYTMPVTSLTLIGGGTDTDGTISSYQWSEVSTNYSTIISPVGASTVVKDLASGTYTFRLTVTDNSGATATDDVVVVVSPHAVGTCSAKTIVVIGSSTSAGYGITPSSDAYVNRFTSYAQSLNPSNTVVNLAIGGYTSYQLLPTGTAVPANRPSPDINANITKALSYNPAAVIINLPSNDVGNGFTNSEQQANFQTILSAATATGVPVWVTTTQPRNFDAAGIANQISMRDWIINTYGVKAINFWDVFANANGTINSAYDQGDGIHLNNIAHKKLYARVAESSLLGDVCATPGNQSPTANAGTDQSITLPVSSVSLTGSGADTDGTIASYVWTKVSGTGGVITSPSSASTGITGLSAGTYIFRLTVTDNLGATASDDMQIVVSPAPVNQAPTVSSSITSVTLSSNANDSDGSIVSYAWTKVSGGSAIIANPALSTTIVNNLSSGTYVFRVTVTDNLGAVASNDIQLTI